ncbi:hypothetical protein R9X49_06375 [Pectobacterium carotovorum]|uniref:hypothetical protein n=1 Tax=Pectobacterium carotovorum TaxID=554 RepID=UPI0029DDB247|nr:hypothetical protein [Pectobacterium carotovorum]MDX6914731.1 hypothetical protein [Pectobacterium carotovorum]
MNTLTNERLEKLKGMASVSQLPALGIQPTELQEMVSRLLASESTLQRLNYTYNGGVEWKPPVGSQPNFSLLDAKQARIDELETQLAELHNQEPFAWARRLIRIKDGGIESYRITQTKTENSEGILYRNEIEPLYKRPVPPAASQPYTVPDAINGGYSDILESGAVDGLTRSESYAKGWNDCRTAILRSGNSPRVPDGSVPEGYALVPNTIYLDESDIESICSQCGDGGGNYGDFTCGILWVGDIQDDEGNITHGLHIYADDYPEEGSITLAKFSAAQQHKGE